MPRKAKSDCAKPAKRKPARVRPHPATKEKDNSFSYSEAVSGPFTDPAVDDGDDDDDPGDAGTIET